MVSLPAPSLIIRQQFVRQATSLIQPLTPFIYGPAAQLVRYSESTEQSLGALGAYDPVGTSVSGVYQTVYSWPNRAAGATIDQTYVSVHVKNAMLKYYQDVSGNAVRTARNVIRHASIIFGTNTYGTTSIGSGRGVKPGDKVLVTGVLPDTSAFSLATYVVALKGDAVAATVGSVTAASSNIPTTVAAANVTAASANSGSVTATSSATAYSGLASRRPTETYTVTVTVGGAAGTAKASVVSASGTDDVAEITLPAVTVAAAIGTRGLTMTWATGTSSAYTIGDKWTVAVTNAFTVPTFAVSGTYTGTADRTYVIEVVQGGLLDTGKVRITSQDGTDSLAAVVATLDSGNASDPIALGSFGLTFVVTATKGLMLGDKWTVAVTAAKEGVLKSVVLGGDLPATTASDNTAAINMKFYVQDDVELPLESTVEGDFQYTMTNTNLSVLAAATASSPKYVAAGVQTRLPIETPSAFGSVSQLYVTYRAWLAATTGVITVTAADDLDTLLSGPTHPDNPLKYAVSLARGTAVGASVKFAGTGDPTVIGNWSTVLLKASRDRGCYGHVPLSLDSDVLTACYNSVASLNGDTTQYYRVLWAGATYKAGGAVIDATKTSNDLIATAIVEANTGASGSPYTLVRLASANAAFATDGVRAGDEVRYNFVVDAWGNETYSTYVVDQVLSETTLLTTTAIGEEAVAKRLEIHRTYTGADLVEEYTDQASVWPSDVVRFVLAPQVVIGSYTLPAYFASALLAGMRAGQPAQQSLSRLAVPGISKVVGLDNLDSGQLDTLAGAGCFTLTDNPENGTVIVRHGITTNAEQILAKREESMVSARHVALFYIVDRLKPYVAQINIGETTREQLSDMLRAELDSVRNGLIANQSTAALGGTILDMVIEFIGGTAASEDTLKIGVRLELGRPGNYIDVGVLIS